jgi:hypothetical protein
LILYQQAEFDFNNASSPTQWRHVAPLGHNSDVKHISLRSYSLMLHDTRGKHKFYDTDSHTGGVPMEDDTDSQHSTGGKRRRPPRQSNIELKEVNLRFCVV